MSDKIVISISTSELILGGLANLAFFNYSIYNTHNLTPIDYSLKSLWNFSTGALIVPLTLKLAQIGITAYIENPKLLCIPLIIGLSTFYIKK